MTRSQRRIRQEKDRRTSAGLTTAYSGDHAARLGLTENPNTGKRHANPATARIRDGLTAAELDRIRTSRREYRELTVRTRLDFGASGRKLAARHHTESSYRI